MGALEWKNAVCLFVNVGGAEYNNLFLDGGRQVTWFAGSQQHDQTPIVRRLLGSERSANTTVLRSQCSHRKYSHSECLGPTPYGSRSYSLWL